MISESKYLALFSAGTCMKFHENHVRTYQEDIWIVFLKVGSALYFTRGLGYFSSVIAHYMECLNLS